MKNMRGQALVEFILVLPILLLVLISTVDFGNILLKKYSLENDLDIVSNMYKQNDTNELNNYLNENDIRIDYKRENDFLTITLYKNIDIISPLLIPILGERYEISTNGVYYE